MFLGIFLKIHYVMVIKKLSMKFIQCDYGSNHAINSHTCPFRPLFYSQDICRIFLNTSFKKTSKFSKYYYVRCIFFKNLKYVNKKKSKIVLLVSKLILSCFYATFKQWLQEVKSPYTYFSLIRLIPNFYDIYIMYSQ
jgi:hypothetical protein